MMKQIKTKDFSLKNTIECGQFFRYKKCSENEYYIQTKDRLFYVKQKTEQNNGKKDKKDILYFDGITKKGLIMFFRLEEDYSKILKQIDKDKYIHKAILKYEGIRIIRQDPWECLISYICSSASNIPKIQKNIELMSEYFGEPINFKEFQSYTFPLPNNICELDKIKKAKTGFRARYIHEVNNRIHDKYFDEIRKMKYEDAKKKLVELPGVGEKVADCVLLFSLGFDNAFPVDTWIKKIMTELYFKGNEKNNKEIAAFAREYFGNNAGLAQEYLFYYMRNKTKTKNKLLFNLI